ncbi:MAG: hypothetical protein SGPRY_007904 [Prymnesium sp.]
MTGPLSEAPRDLWERGPSSAEAAAVPSLRDGADVREFAPANSRRHSLRWAVLWGGHNLLLRGGEFGCPDHKRFDPKIGLTIADFDWIAPCVETDWFYAVVVDVLPIKDERVTRERVPVLIRRRSPFFSLPNTVVVHTSEVLDFIREAAAAANEDPSDFDARALRICGATDLYHLFGPAEAERHIADWGRWKSGILDIYSRLSATAMLEVSVRMGDASGVDLEAFRHGYSMPATRRRSSRHRYGMFFFLIRAFFVPSSWVVAQKIPSESIASACEC